jgi:hypothetical protein
MMTIDQWKDISISLVCLQPAATEAGERQERMFHGGLSTAWKSHAEH